MPTSIVWRPVMHHRAHPRTYPDKRRPASAGRRLPAAATAATTAEAGAAAPGRWQRRDRAGEAAGEERGVEGRQVIVPDVPVGNDVWQPSHRDEIGTDLRPTVGQVEDDRPGQILRED